MKIETDDRGKELLALARLVAFALESAKSLDAEVVEFCLDKALRAVLDQIDHGVRLLGIDHVGIGSDFDGVSGELPADLRTVADFPKLVAGLQQRGYADADIRKILGGNLMRVWAAVEAGASRKR